MAALFKLLFLALFLNIIGVSGQQILSPEAIAAARQNNYQPALQELNKALETNPKNEVALTQRANVLIRLKNFDEALIDAEKAYKINPQNPDACFLAATALISQEKNIQALQYLDAALKIKPDIHQALQFRGKLHAKMNAADLAIADLDKAISQNPKDLEAYLYRGRMHTIKIKFVDAMNDFLFIINNAPADSPLKDLAKTDFDKAHAEYEEYEKAGGVFFRLSQ